jgi:hypothetical protein
MALQLGWYHLSSKLYGKEPASSAIFDAVNPICLVVVDLPFGENDIPKIWIVIKFHGSQPPTSNNKPN